MDCSLPGSYVHGIARQEYWSGLPFPSPGDLADQGLEPTSPALQADSFTNFYEGSHMEENGCPLKFDKIEFQFW